MTASVTRLSAATPAAVAAGGDSKPQRSTFSRALPLGIGILATIALLICSVMVGTADLASEDGARFLWVTRIPRTAALMLAGASMAMAGLIMQLMTQNRFVEPTTVGTTEWAGLGLLLTYIAIPAPPLMARMLIAIGFAFIGCLLFFAFLRRVTLKSSLIVPIVGIMFGAVVSAVTTFLAIKFNLLQMLGSWFAGRFNSVEAGRYEPLWGVVIVAAIVVVVADRFTVAGLGKDVATNVGLNYERIVLLGVALVAVVTGMVTVIIGALPFLGLIVPNIVSMIRGDNLRTNIPWVFLTGIWIITACDLIGRTIISPYEIPVSLVLGVVGAVVFIVLLLRMRGSHAK